MTAFTNGVIYIGKFAQADVVEGNFTTENNPFTGTTVDWNTLVATTVSGDDAGANVIQAGLVDDDDWVGDTLTYDIGNGPITVMQDSSEIFYVRLTMQDGSQKVVEVILIQMVNGDTFINDLKNEGNLDNLVIRSVEILDVTDDTATGWFSYQSVSGTTIVCFTKGTQIATAQGQVLIEELSVGDDVRVLDGGTQEIRWIGSHKVSAAALAANPKLYPVRIRAGALGSGLPEQDLLVSPQHRVLVRSAIAQRMFGTLEVLVPAKKLLGLDGIEIADDVQEVEYFHILFDAHQVVFSNGAPTESLFTGVEALKSVSPEARAEIETLFPEICAPDFKAQPARFIPGKGKLMKQLVERHQKNMMPLYSITRAAPSVGESPVGM